MSQPTISVNPLREEVKVYGCHDLLELGHEFNAPKQIDYLDLLPPRGSRSKKGHVDGVVEHQGTALLYLVDGRGEDKKIDVSATQKLLANRSDPAWLGIIRQGSLEIFPIGFHCNNGDNSDELVKEVGTFNFGSSEPAPFKCIEKSNDGAPLLFQSLAQKTFSEETTVNSTDHVYRLIYDLLIKTTDAFVERNILPPLEVLSMIGRALFFRFLIDRRIVRESELEEICPKAKNLKDVFSNAEKSSATSAWLDETFNGDFLALIDEKIPSDDRSAREKAYGRFYKSVQQKAGVAFFDHLEAILRGWRHVGQDFQMELDWVDFNFAHIPVGVLSQVYESFSHRADPVSSRQTSVHYTPRTIAKLMVDECLGGAPEAASAKVLDPSCGAGIFLVLTFRRLVQERWEKDGKRPDKTVIHDILYQQIRGFDLSESALRLAALSLYITAIEINGTQRPPRILKFPKNLRKSVLFHYGKNKNSEDHNDPLLLLGSLGSDVSKSFNGFFDIVIGNPPWTRLRSLIPDNLQSNDKATVALARKQSSILKSYYTAIGKRVLRERGLEDLANTYENPDKNPDLPFLWRSTEWAKKGGIIALAMHGRLFQTTYGNGAKAWQAILKSVCINGMINGTDLRTTNVWEGMKAPWCLVFLKNERPKLNHKFHFSTPPQDKTLNSVGRFRIDYESAKVVSVDSLEQKPWLLKALSLGTWIDVDVVDSILNAYPLSLGKVWKSWDPKEKQTGKGFDPSSNLKQHSDTFLATMPVFDKKHAGYQIAYADLPIYKELHTKGTAHAPRTKLLYQPPLVIVPQTPGEDPCTAQAYISDKAVAFSQSYYGYSCAGHPHAELLRCLIYIICHSTLFRYFILMTSRSQGTDYMRFIKQDIDSIPFPDPENLSEDRKAKLLKLTNALQKNARKPWEKIDEFVFKLYAIDSDDIQVIKDTLFTSAPYRNMGRPALEVTRQQDRMVFIRELQAMLHPFFEICGKKVEVADMVDFKTDYHRDAWAFISICRSEKKFSVSSSLIRKAMELADRHGSSHITIRVPGKKGLLVGLLNQRRWWTATRARLCGQQIISQHLEACGLSISE